jgi:hypothetical protein
MDWDGHGSILIEVSFLTLSQHPDWLWGHPAYYSMAQEILSWGLKWLGREATRCAKVKHGGAVHWHTTAPSSKKQFRGW